MKKRKLIGAGSNVGGSGISLWHSEIFARISKICNGSKNFAIQAKIWLWPNFAIIEKITVHSEILNFCYASDFRYDSEISLS